MGMTLGNVGRASYSEFAGKRKLLVVPYVTATRDDAALHKMIDTYWSDALAQVRKLQVGLGEVRHLFHEGSLGEGEEAEGVLELGNPAGYPQLEHLIREGAVLEPTEDTECLKETLDLHRCLSVVQASDLVLQRLLGWFEESRQRRYAAIANQVSERLAENGVGVLVISPDHEVKFAADIEVVHVVPPILDRINRWIQDHPRGADATGLPPTDDETPDWAK